MLTRKPVEGDLVRSHTTGRVFKVVETPTTDLCAIEPVRRIPTLDHKGPGLFIWRHPDGLNMDFTFIVTGRVKVD